MPTYRDLHNRALVGKNRLSNHSYGLGTGSGSIVHANSADLKAYDANMKRLIEKNSSIGDGIDPRIKALYQKGMDEQARQEEIQRLMASEEAGDSLNNTLWGGNDGQTGDLGFGTDDYTPGSDPLGDALRNPDAPATVPWVNPDPKQEEPEPAPNEEEASEEETAEDADDDNKNQEPALGQPIGTPKKNKAATKGGDADGGPTDTSTAAKKKDNDNLKKDIAKAVATEGGNVAADAKVAKEVVKKTAPCCLAGVFMAAFIMVVAVQMTSPVPAGALTPAGNPLTSGRITVEPPPTPPVVPPVVPPTVPPSTPTTGVPAMTTSLVVGGKTIRMPASRGRTAREQYLPGMTFSSQCNATEEKWYISMRWPYVAWRFSGHTTLVSSSTTATKFKYATVRVVVHNPRNNKTVITAICESGPAPWTGSSWFSSLSDYIRAKTSRVHVAAEDNPPNFWRSPKQFDPPEADGRVSGLAPDAFAAIGATNNGVLEYGFAVDQSLPLGPVR